MHFQVLRWCYRPHFEDQVQGIVSKNALLSPLQDLLRALLSTQCRPCPEHKNWNPWWYNFEQHYHQ
jgi:hypothetical protein